MRVQRTMMGWLGVSKGTGRVARCCHVTATNYFMGYLLPYFMGYLLPALTLEASPWQPASDATPVILQIIPSLRSETVNLGNFFNYIFKLWTKGKTTRTSEKTLCRRAAPRTQASVQPSNMSASGCVDTFNINTQSQAF